MQQKTNVNLIKYKIKNFCNVIIPPEDTKILEFNQYLKKKKNDKAPFIIYADFECISENIPSGFSMSTLSSFKKI